MPRVVYDPTASSIVADLLLEAADGKSTLLIPVVLDTGAGLTIVATDIMARLGYDPANPTLARHRIITGSGVEYAPRATVKSATAIGQKVANLDVLCHDLPPESGVDGLLGLNFLKHFKLTIRYPFDSAQDKLPRRICIVGLGPFASQSKVFVLPF